MTMANWGGGDEMFTRPEDEPAPTRAPGPVELDNSAAYYWRQWREAQDVIKAWEATAAEAKAHLIDALGESETGTIGGVAVVKYTRVTSSRLDQTLLRSGWPDAYDACKTPQTTRRFTVMDVVEVRND